MRNSFQNQSPALRAIRHREASLTAANMLRSPLQAGLIKAFNVSSAVFINRFVLLRWALPTLLFHVQKSLNRALFLFSLTIRELPQI